MHCGLYKGTIFRIFECAIFMILTTIIEESESGTFCVHPARTSAALVAYSSASDVTDGPGYGYTSPAIWRGRILVWSGHRRSGFVVMRGVVQPLWTDPRQKPHWDEQETCKFFPVVNQFATARLTHYSTMLQRPWRSTIHVLLSGDVHMNPVATIKYPGAVCSSNVTSHGMSYLCNSWFGLVHSKCSGLQNTGEYQQIINWACSSCHSPPLPPIPQPLLTSTPIQTDYGNPLSYAVQLK